MSHYVYRVYGIEDRLLYVGRAGRVAELTPALPAFPCLVCGATAEPGDDLCTDHGGMPDGITRHALMRAHK